MNFSPLPSEWTALLDWGRFGFTGNRRFFHSWMLSPHLLFPLLCCGFGSLWDKVPPAKSNFLLTLSRSGPAGTRCFGLFISCYGLPSLPVQEMMYCPRKASISHPCTSSIFSTLLLSECFDKASLRLLQPCIQHSPYLAVSQSPFMWFG